MFLRGARRGRRALAAVAAGLAIAVLAGCGSGGTTTVIERVPTKQSAEASPAKRTPHGALTVEGVGPATSGMSTKEVRALFGEPEHIEQVSGCEVNPDSTPSLVWEWQLGAGRLLLTFDGLSGRLSSYRADTTELETTIGDRVGDSYASLHEGWGPALKPLSLGVASTPQQGYWYVGDPSNAELLFDVRNGQINSISGGYLPPCE